MTRRPVGKVSPCGNIQLFSNDGELSASDQSIGECLSAVFKKHGGTRSLEARAAVGAEVRRLFESEYAAILWSWRDARTALFTEKKKGTCQECGVFCGDLVLHRKYHEKRGEKVAIVEDPRGIGQKKAEDSGALLRIGG